MACNHAKKATEHQRTKNRKLTAQELCGASQRCKGIQPLLDSVCDFLPSPLDLPPVKGKVPRSKRLSAGEELEDFWPDLPAPWDEEWNDRQWRRETQARDTEAYLRRNEWAKRSTCDRRSHKCSNW